MENKQVESVKSITGALIGGFLLYGILFGVLYNYVYSTISEMFSADSLIPLAIISIILQGLTGFCVWRFSIATTFSKRLIDRNDVQTVIKNLMIFVVIISFITALMDYSEINKKIDVAINSNTSLTLSEKYMQYLYDDEEIAQYQAEKEKAISEVKTKFYTYFVVLQIGLLIVNLGIIPLQKNFILKYSV